MKICVHKSTPPTVHILSCIYLYLYISIVVEDRRQGTLANLEEMLAKQRPGYSTIVYLLVYTETGIYWLQRQGYVGYRDRDMLVSEIWICWLQRYGYVGYRDMDMLITEIWIC